MKFKHGYTLEEIIESGKKFKGRIVNGPIDADIKGRVTFFKDIQGARETPCSSGYRPTHQVKVDYQTTGLHIYIDVDVVFPGESAEVFIWFITPEVYSNCLWQGKKIDVSEGGNIVGYVEVLEVYNEILLKEQ